jgi:phospholipase C
MNRRKFLTTTAGAVAAANLRSASAQSATSSIKHIIHLMMENRSFDHLMGWFPNADGKQAGLQYIDKNGQAQPTHSLSGQWTGCGHPDPDHSYAGGRTEYDNGLMDGFLQPADNDLYSIGYYTERDVPVLAAIARNFTLCDRFFPSMLGPTFPNKIFSLCGQSDRTGDTVTFCKLPTIWDTLQAAGVGHKYYYGNVPFSVLWGTKYLDFSFKLDTFLADCAAGTLPSVSFLDPTFTLALNLANDDHPHSDIRNGEAFLSQVYQAVASSPNWMNTVLVINRDEWGGFFEHIVPPRALAPNDVDTDLVNGEALLGCRVPVVIVSPWTVGDPRHPTVNSTVFDHTSVLKMIESVFGAAPLAARETSDTVGNVLSAIDLTKTPQPAPAIPTAKPVFPQSLCATSVTSGSGSFQRLVNAGLLAGWPVTP